MNGSILFDFSRNNLRIYIYISTQKGRNFHSINGGHYFIDKSRAIGEVHGGSADMFASLSDLIF
jgi:hypothetical protein